MIQWTLGKTDVPVFQTFFGAFKKKWAKSSVLGLILGLVGLLLFILHCAAAAADQSFSLFIIYAIILLYAFPIDVHYDLKRIAVLKYSFIIGFSCPLTSFFMPYQRVWHAFCSLYFMSHFFCFSAAAL